MKLIKSYLASVIIAGGLFSALPVLANTAPAPTQTTTQTVVLQDKVNVNTATAAELQRVLIGIGEKKAQAIVDYREKNGTFNAAEQLLEVQGFGSATLEKNKDRILL